MNSEKMIKEILEDADMLPEQKPIDKEEVVNAVKSIIDAMALNIAMEEIDE